jgi:HK97 family phage major capsid protein
VNDTSNVGALLSENVQDSEQDVTFGNLTLDAYKYTSKIVRVSVELMQDSAFNMGSVLGSLLGERLGRIQNTHATTGTGSSQPNGVITASTLGKTAAATGAVTMDELLDLQASVDPAYRMGSTWMFNDATRNEIRQLKSTDSVYHWSPGAIAGDPDRLFTSPVVINQDMASMATTTKPVLYGQLSKYLMREVLGVTLVRMNERYADYHQVAFVAIMRFDGDLLDAGTNPVKYLQMA